MTHQYIAVWEATEGKNAASKPVGGLADVMTMLWAAAPQSWPDKFVNIKDGSDTAKVISPLGLFISEQNQWSAKL